MADQSDRVVGVDIVEEAVVNARKNAKQNGVTNAEYHAGTFPSIYQARKIASRKIEFHKY